MLSGMGYRTGSRRRLISTNFGTRTRFPAQENDQTNWRETAGMRRNILRCVGHCMLSGMFFLALSPKLCGATYYVGTTGDDAADGSEAHPWATVNRAAQAVSPGDTAVVMPGTYYGEVEIRKGGTPENPVTFRSQMPHAAVLTYQRPVPRP